MELGGGGNSPISSLSRDSVLNNYKLKFEEVDNKKTKVGVINKISAFINSVNNIKFRWTTHVVAEHMSQGELSRNSRSAHSITINLLKEMNSVEFDEPLNALNYANEVRKKSALRSASSVAADIKNDIKSLKKNESRAIPSTSKNHAMTMLITCTSDIHPKKYKVVNYNMGEGIHRYHYSRETSNGKIEYQTAFIIKDVPLSSLCSKESTFFKDIIKNSNSFFGGSVDILYKSIIPELKGEIENPSSDERLWSDGQLGGSCTARCDLSLIRSLVTLDQYKQVIDTARYEMLLKLFKQIKKGGYTSHIQKIVSLEAIAKLEYSYQKQNLKLPDEIGKMKMELEHLIKAKKRMKSYAPPTTNLAHNLDIAFKILNDGEFSQVAIANASKYIDAKTIDVTIADYKKLVRLLLTIRSYCKDQPLTRTQIYFLSLLSTKMLEPITELKEQGPKKYKKMLGTAARFAMEMFDKFARLSLQNQFQGNPLYPDIGSKVTGLINKYALGVQGNVHNHPGISKPAGLENISKLMGA